MAEDKKEDGIDEYKVTYDQNLPAKKSTPDALQKEEMYQAFRRGASIKEISDRFSFGVKTVSKYKKEGDWDVRKQKELEERQKIEQTEVEDIAKEAYTKLLKITFKLIVDFEKYVFEGTDKGSPIPLKVLTEAVEKLTKLHYFSAAGGVEKTKTESVTRTVHERIDYAALAKAHVENKRLNPNYDEKALLKDVVDVAYKKSKK